MSLKVLIVEDEAVLVRVIRRALVRGFDVDVDEAADGLSGLEHASLQSYALIVSDIRMPHMDGLSMIRRIRDGDGPNRDTPIVILTGHHDEGRAAARELGARFMPKPFSRQRLLALVGELL
ncbi:response regulator [Paraliomyxa miuraensis]|uniref:response regulator n=1 Tax=Paraliomyxa miuraensis TaxID=376150 RepID=UPI0022517E73|nr:response regulator [Paraliomyxa miuraensis]MCX4242920.1 response regulator [Paraliomyxa miuraensis]